MNTEIINSVEALLFGSGRPMRLSEIKNTLEPIRETVTVLDGKVDRIKEKSFMDDEEYAKKKERENQE